MHGRSKDEAHACHDVDAQMGPEQLSSTCPSSRSRSSSSSGGKL